MTQNWCFAVASALSAPESGGRAHLWLDGDERVVIVPLGDPLALTTWALARDELQHLVFVGRAAHAPWMAVAANTLTGRLPDLQVNMSTWRTTTLSLAALSAQVHEAAQSAYEAVAQMQELVPHAWSGVWMPSVTGLREPAPTFGQHFRSMLPSPAGFLATLTPKPEVVRLRPGGGVPPVPGSTLIVGGRLHDSDLDAVQRHAGVPQSVVLPSVEDGKSQYGSAGAVELVWMPDVSTCSLSRPSAWCRVCRGPVWGEFCPFCHVAVVHYQEGAA